LPDTHKGLAMYYLSILNAIYMIIWSFAILKQALPQIRYNQQIEILHKLKLDTFIYMQLEN